MPLFRTMAMVTLFATAIAACNTEATPLEHWVETRVLPDLDSRDADGKDLVVGAVVAAFESTGGVRLLKVIDVKFFPPPMSDALIMNAYDKKGNDFAEAFRLWRKGGLKLEGKVDVQRHMFRKRNYRILRIEPVTDADRSAKPPDSPRAQP
jgi:hypothetical protein